MALEEQIQRYCFHLIKNKLFIFLIIFIFLSLFTFLLLFNASINKGKIIEIEKGASIKEISSLILNDKSFFEKKYLEYISNYMIYILII